jgi:hypothetical protein
MTAPHATPSGRPVDRPLRLRCIGCEVLARPLYLAAATSRHIVDVELLRRGLHDVPVNLRDRLQAMILETEAAAYDAVVLGYALCGQATAGLRAGTIPLVVPRATASRSSSATASAIDASPRRIRVPSGTRRTTSSGYTVFGDS